MKTALARLAPSATDLIRADHTRVLVAFHRYRLESRPRTKRALVDAICLALEVHAQVEEEIFYPAMREAGSAVVEKSVPEHEEMRTLIAALRRLDPGAGQYDATFMDLMRAVMHHMADEETTLLPHAESLLGARLGALGARMAARRMRLKLPRSAEMAQSAARGAPANVALLAAGALLAGFMVLRQKRSHPKVAS